MEKDTVMVTCRIPRDEVLCLDERAREAGCTRSEYIRRVLKLPVAMRLETSASLRERTDADPLGEGCEGRRGEMRQDCGSLDSLTLGTSEGDGNGGRAVLVLTDVPIRKLCVAIDRWGTNYNQAVRALNALVRRMQAVREIDADDAQEIFYLLQVCAHGNENAKNGIDKVAEEVRRLTCAASVDMRRNKLATARIACGGEGSSGCHAACEGDGEGIR